MERILEVVNENDEIIGRETREKIHEQGLLHREVHVYFITPNKEIIFQHRAKDKDTNPGLLDATVGGHVEPGDSYERAAIREVEEETGVKIKTSNLIPMEKIKRYFKDKLTGKINNFFSFHYAYIYRGRIEDLRIEAGKATGFEARPLDKLSRLSDQEKAKFIPYIINFATTELPVFIKDLEIN